MFILCSPMMYHVPVQGDKISKKITIKLIILVNFTLFLVFKKSIIHTLYSMNTGIFP